jgi:hypothetical protein
MNQRKIEEVLYGPEGLELISNRNLVDLYREELLDIYENGVNALDLLGEGIHRNMTRHGILHVRHRYAGRETVISPMWLRYLLDDSL